MKYIALCFFIFISGCMSVREDMELIKKEAQDRIFNDQNYMPVDGDIDFGEAMARAVKYNLEHKVMVISKVFEDG